MNPSHLSWLSNQAGDFLIALVLDVYSAQKTEKVINQANNMDIELLFVPAGGTLQYQPLDRKIFGEIKSRARREYLILAAQTGNTRSRPQHGIVNVRDVLDCCFVREREKRLGWHLNSTFS